MARCTYCRRRFCSEQAVRAHLKHCPRYKTVTSQKTGALGREPKAAATATATPPFAASLAGAPPDLATSGGEFIKSMDEFSRKLEEPPSTQQRRRTILQAAKACVIDSYRTSVGQVTIAMRGAGKTEIERELFTLPLEELPFEEVLELAVAIRDRVYVPVFRKHAQQVARQRVEQKAQHQKELEALGAWRRADRRKTALIDQTLGQARAWCAAKQIVGWDRLSVLGDVKSRLTEFLTGEESVPDAQVIVQGTLEARFAEAELMLSVAREEADEKWREEVVALVVLGGTLILPVLAAMYPAQTTQVFAWLERIFGWPAAAADSAPSASAEPAASHASASAPPPRRRWQKTAAPSFSPGFSPWGHPFAPATHGVAPHPPEEPVSAQGADSLSS